MNEKQWKDFLDEKIKVKITNKELESEFLYQCEALGIMWEDDSKPTALSYSKFQPNEFIMIINGRLRVCGKRSHFLHNQHIVDSKNLILFTSVKKYPYSEEDEQE